MLESTEGQKLDAIIHQCAAREATYIWTDKSESPLDGGKCLDTPEGKFSFIVFQEPNSSFLHQMEEKDFDLAKMIVNQ